MLQLVLLQYLFLAVLRLFILAMKQSLNRKTYSVKKIFCAKMLEQFRCKYAIVFVCCVVVEGYLLVATSKFCWDKTCAYILPLPSLLLYYQHRRLVGHRTEKNHVDRVLCRLQQMFHLPPHTLWIQTAVQFVVPGYASKAMPGPTKTVGVHCLVIVTFKLFRTIGSSMIKQRGSAVSSAAEGPCIVNIMKITV